MRTWIKICGTTSVADAIAGVEAGADALGFIFASSKRQITPAKAQEVIRELPGTVERIGVFVDESAERIRAVAEQAGLTGVQLHGSESPEFVAGLNSAAGGRLRVIKSVIITGDFHLELEKFVMANSPPGAILLDSGAGSGEMFDWRGVRPFLTGTEMRFIVAGGLAPENVGAALRIFHPWGVDVVSGVESEPRRKDPAKLNAFVAAVREAEKQLWAAQH